MLAGSTRSHQVIQSGRVDGAWAHGIHANAAIPQVRRPGPCERAHGGFGGAVDTIRRQPLTADDGRIQDDRATIRHQRKRLLDREQEAFHIDAEDRVIVLFSDLAERRVRRSPGIREHDIERALFPLDLCEEAIEIAELRNVAPDSGDVVADLLDRRRQLGITPPSDEHVRALADERLRRRQANPAIATGHESDLALELPHVSTPPRLFLCRIAFSDDRADEPAIQALPARDVAPSRFS